MLPVRRFLSLLLVTALTSVTVISCSLSSSSSDTAIQIGSKDFTEQLILGQMYALALEDKGYSVERKLNLGGTPVAQAGLEEGEIDLYPEYTGTALLTVLKLPVKNNSQEVYETVSQAYRQRYNLNWLQPSPMSNTQTLVMTPEGSQKYGINTISDFVADANKLIMVGSPEFQEREDGLPGLKKVYSDFELKEFKAVNPGLRYEALVNREADVAVGFSTDGEISAMNLVMLEDNKNLFPPYHVAPVVRQAVLENQPGIADILNSITTKITTDTMQRLNYEVTGKNQEPAKVAKDFLSKAGLVEGNSSEEWGSEEKS